MLELRPLCDRSLGVESGGVAGSVGDRPSSERNSLGPVQLAPRERFNVFIGVFRGETVAVQAGGIARAQSPSAAARAAANARPQISAALGRDVPGIGSPHVPELAGHRWIGTPAGLSIMQTLAPMAVGLRGHEVQAPIVPLTVASSADLDVARHRQRAACLALALLMVSSLPDARWRARRVAEIEAPSPASRARYEAARPGDHALGEQRVPAALGAALLDRCRASRPRRWPRAGGICCKTRHWCKTRSSQRASRYSGRHRHVCNELQNTQPAHGWRPIVRVRDGQARRLARDNEGSSAMRHARYLAGGLAYGREASFISTSRAGLRREGLQRNAAEYLCWYS